MSRPNYKLKEFSGTYSEILEEISKSDFKPIDLPTHIYANNYQNIEKPVHLLTTTISNFNPYQKIIEINHENKFKLPLVNSTYRKDKLWKILFGIYKRENKKHTKIYKNFLEKISFIKDRKSLRDLIFSQLEDLPNKNDDIILFKYTGFSMNNPYNLKCESISKDEIIKTYGVKEIIYNDQILNKEGSLTFIDPKIGEIALNQTSFSTSIIN